MEIEVNEQRQQLGYIQQNALQNTPPPILNIQQQQKCFTIYKTINY